MILEFEATSIRADLCRVTWRVEKKTLKIYAKKRFIYTKVVLLLIKEENSAVMAQGQIKKSSSLLAKGNKKPQNAKLSKGGNFPAKK